VEPSEGERRRRCNWCIDIEVLTLRVWEASRRGECESGSMPSIDSGYFNVEFAAVSFCRIKKSGCWGRPCGVVDWATLGHRDASALKLARR